MQPDEDERFDGDGLGDFEDDGDDYMGCGDSWCHMCGDEDDPDDEVDDED